VRGYAVGMSSAAKRLNGNLTQWNDARGFGFLTPRLSHEQTFVHISAFPRGAARPRLGAVYSFAVEVSRDGKRQATQVQPEERQDDRSQHAPRPPGTGASHPLRRRARRRGSASYLAIVAFVAVVLVGAVFWPVPLWVAGLYAAVSVVCYLAYLVDKRAALAGRWRVAEGTLLTLGFLGGWPGAIVAQQTLRHKTQKASFRRAFWGSVVLNVLLFVALAMFAAPLWSRVGFG